MSWDGRCGCGRVYSLPDRAASPRVVCSCGLTVPLRFVRGSSGRMIALAIVVPLSLIGTLVGVYLALRRPENPYAIGAPETVEEKYRSAAEAFASGSGAEIDPSGDEPRVRAVLQSLVSAEAAGDWNRFAEQFHYRRMLAEIESYGTLPRIKNRRDESNFVKGMRMGIARMAQDHSSMGLQWKSIDVVRVRFDAARGEAVAFCAVTIGDARSKFRFWLIKEREFWKVFDFESMGEAIRISVAISSVSAGVLADSSKLAEMNRAVAEFKKAVLQITQQDFEGALQTIRKAHSLPPVPFLQPQLYMLEGSALVALGKSEEALPILDRALSIQGDFPTVRLLKGTALQALGRHEQAIREFEDYFKMLGDDAEAYLALGRSLRALERFDEAIRAFEKGARCDAKEWENRLELGDLLASRKETERATRVLIEAVRNSPDSYPSAISSLREAKDYASVLELSEERAKLPEPGTGPAWDRGNALRLLGRFEEAEKVLREGVSKATEEEIQPYWEELAMALAHLGRADEAMKWADRWRKENPDSGYGDYLSAYIHAASGRADEALRAAAGALDRAPWLHETIEQSPPFAEMRSKEPLKGRLERARLKTEYDDEAEELMEEAKFEELAALSERRLLAAPADVDARFHRAHSLRRLRRFGEAEKAAAGAEAEERLIEERGYILAHLGRAAEALGCADRLTHEPDAHLLRAYVHAVGGDPARALRSIEKLLEAAPEYLGLVEQEGAFAEILRTAAAQEILRKVKSRKE